MGALVASAIGAANAQADVYSCAFTGGMGPVSPYNDAVEARTDRGVEAIANDALNDEGDGIPKVASVLTDTDNGNGSGERTGQDGSYAFSTDAALAKCVYVETGGDPGRVSGVYEGTIQSEGEYDNVVCGTGWMGDDDLNRNGVPPEVTSLTFGNPAVADLLDLDFRIDFFAAQGVLDIGDADNADGESGAGHVVDGAASIQPRTGNCVTEDVTSFQVTGTLRVPTSGETGLRGP